MKRRRAWKIINPDNSATVIGYDAMGNRSTVTDAAGHAVSYTYDALNRLQTITQPGGAITTYAYDSQNHLKTVTDAEGRVTSSPSTTWATS